jgi:hypothetical protein
LESGIRSSGLWGKTKNKNGKMKHKNYSSALLATALLGLFAPLASTMAAPANSVDGGRAVPANFQTSPAPGPVAGAVLVGGIGLLAIMKLRRNTL